MKIGIQRMPAGTDIADFGRRLPEWIKRPARVFGAGYLARLTAAPRFDDFIHQRQQFLEPNVPYMNKIMVTELVTKLSLRAAKTLAIYEHPEDFDGLSLPERFVLKPTDCCSTKGVMLLRRDGERWYDAMRKRVLTANEIKAEQAALAEETRQKFPSSTPKIIVEELIEDEAGRDIIPFDYKLYTFSGVVRFIVQIDRNASPPRIAFYRDEFTPIDFTKYFEPKLQACQHGDYRLPRCWLAMLDTAKQISLALPTPFISVDMYASPDGPVVGELTPTPGGGYWGMWTTQPWYDKELGQAWADSIRRRATMKRQDQKVKPASISADIFVGAARHLPDWVKRRARAVGAGHIARRLSPPTPRRIFGHLDEARWLATLTASIKHPIQKGITLPGFPDAGLQVDTVGSAYEATLAEASRFYSFVRQTCLANGKPIGPRTTILDFGVGWGRIIRFFLKDTDADCLHGVDVSERYLRAARETACQAHLHQIDPLGPMPHVDGTFDVVYAYSVFTHLPERVQDHWLAEIRRVLKPGGIFIATVESFRRIDYYCGIDPNDEDIHPRTRKLASTITSDPEFRSRLARDGLFHIPMNDTYGDTMMTPEYLRRHWASYFEIIEFLDDPNRIWQGVATLRRPLH